MKNGSFLNSRKGNIFFLSSNNLEPNRKNIMWSGRILICDGEIVPQSTPFTDLLPWKKIYHSITIILNFPLRKIRINHCSSINKTEYFILKYLIVPIALIVRIRKLSNLKLSSLALNSEVQRRISWNINKEFIIET